jgi:uncharacterized repeat protein (TIGR01451 family)
LSRRRLSGLAAVATALVIGVGAPLLVHAGFIFNATLTKTHAGNFTVGSNGTFTITVSMSSGGVNSDSFTVTDSLPSGLSYVTAGGPSFTCSNAGQVVTCQGAPSFSGPGATHPMTVVAGVGAGAAPSVTNTASFNDQFSGDNVASDNTARDTVTVNLAATSTSSTTTTTSTTSSTSTSTPASTSSAAAISAPAAGASPAGGAGAGALWALLAVGGGLGSVFGVSFLRRRH